MLGRPTRLRTAQSSLGDEPPARKAERICVDAQVFLRRSGQLNYRVRAYDVTRFGIKFEGFSAVEGLVCWIDGFVAGIEFVHAIHPAVFDSLMPRLR